MSFPARYFKGAAATGNLDTIAAGVSVGGTSYPTNEIAVDTLSCQFVVDAETDTLTIACHWQVSHDNSSWYDVKPSNGAAYVAQATGTMGADAAVNVVLEAPTGVLGWEYVRPAVKVGVTTGTVNDTYSMQVCFRKFNGFG
jgi:hypothetical protein